MKECFFIGELAITMQESYLKANNGKRSDCNGKDNCMKVDQRKTMRSASEVIECITLLRNLQKKGDEKKDELELNTRRKGKVSRAK